MVDEADRSAHELVADVAAALYRAYRAIRFYPPEHPVASQSLDRLVAVLERALGAVGPIRLEARGRTLVFDEEVVYGVDDPRDSIAEVMSVDGIRSVTFHPEVEPEEAAAFVQALVQAKAADHDEHDLATILWELDLPHVEYRVVDPLLEGEPSDGREGARVREQVAETLRDAGSPDLGRPMEPRPSILAMLDVAHEAEGPPPGGALVDAQELSRIEESMRQEPDILADFLEVLSEVLAGAVDDSEVTSASRAISDVLHSYMEWGEFEALVGAVHRLRALQAAAPRREVVVDGILSALATPDALRAAVFGLDGPQADKRPALEEFLYLMRGQAYPALVELLKEAGGQASRKCILNVCVRGEGIPVSYIAPLLSDPRWYVVRNMVFLLGSLPHRDSLPHLEEALDHPDERVRREAVRALGSIGGRRSAYLLTSCLSDPAASVRILAARSLPRAGREDAAAALVAQVTSREFQTRDETEIDAFFEALTEVVDDRALPHLDGLWSTRSFLRNRPAAIRLGALKVIGHIGSPAAKDILIRASRSGDEDVRRQAKRSLAEAERRTVGP